jgi:hypothetical protein
MSELTKEYFDQVVSTLATNADMASGLAATEKRIIKRIDAAQEELAVMVNSGFEDVMERLDVRQEVDTLKTQMAELRAALHLSN